jgi:uncharacterized protein (DUF2252 family)
MAASPFAFYRGAALIMASDLAKTPTSGLTTQICGDAHLANFGFFASPERRLVFDINDFDETAKGPWEWDVKRLAASVEIAGRQRGFSGKQRRRAVSEGTRAYRIAMRKFATMPMLDVWYSKIDVDAVLPQIRAELHPDRATMLVKALRKVRSRGSAQAFGKFTHEVDGQPQILDQPPLIMRLPGLVEENDGDSIDRMIREFFRSYRKTLETDRRHLLDQFQVVDVARKVVGVGSVGTRAWIVLLLGGDVSDPLILQLKEAEASVVERFAGRSRLANHAQRVVAGQRLMQATSDIFLGWNRGFGADHQERDFYVRQFRDWKGSIDVDTILPNGLPIYARYCGWTLARAHARSGDRIAIAAYLGSSTVFEDTIAEFARRYADRNERDFDALKTAIKEHRIEAQVGV